MPHRAEQDLGTGGQLGTCGTAPWHDNSGVLVSCGHCSHRDPVVSPWRQQPLRSALSLCPPMAPSVPLPCVTKALAHASCPGDTAVCPHHTGAVLNHQGRLTEQRCHTAGSAGHRVSWLPCSTHHQTPHGAWGAPTEAEPLCPSPLSTRPGAAPAAGRGEHRAVAAAEGRRGRSGTGPGRCCSHPGSAHSPPGACPWAEPQHRALGVACVTAAAGVSCSGYLYPSGKEPIARQP